MALFEYVCDTCGREWDVLTTISDPATSRCECGEEGRKLFPREVSFKEKELTAHEKLVRSGNAEKLEREFHIANRNHIEKNMHKVASGEMEITVQGPEEFRPRNLPESKTRYSCPI